MKTEKYPIQVRQANGTYKTSSVHGLSASCTAGDQNAADALGRKLFKERFIKATELPREPHLEYNGRTHWQLEARKP
ncbi:MAG: hypothetical protein B7Y42_00350 [Polaromonas sp. 28-63-22]|nr:MAG: hypothetical protein B7Y42_00350 [Polaromonas sp. 28-63-22]